MKASKIISLIEKLLNPEDNYPSKFDHDIDHSMDAHRDLSDEFNEKVLRHHDDGPKGRAISHYTGTGYHEINDHLRHGSKLIDADAIPRNTHLKHLKELSNNRTNHEFLAYRGTTEKIGSHVPGDIVQDKGFTSVSLRPQVAKRFTNSTPSALSIPEPNSHLYRIHIKPGTKGFYASGHMASNEKEREFILKPGTKFRVGDSHVHPSGDTYTDLHIHSQED